MLPGNHVLALHYTGRTSSQTWFCNLCDTLSLTVSRLITNTASPTESQTKWPEADYTTKATSPCHQENSRQSLFFSFSVSLFSCSRVSLIVQADLELNPPAPISPELWLQEHATMPTWIQSVIHFPKPKCAMMHTVLCNYSFKKICSWGRVLYSPGRPGTC